MKEELRQSILNVAQAMDGLNRVFEKQVEVFEQQGDAQELQRWTRAAQAMRDSGRIYLTWANHYARAAGADVTDEPASEDFLDEAGSWS
jgi:hypothetical protein